MRECATINIRFEIHTGLGLETILDGSSLPHFLSICSHLPQPPEKSPKTPLGCVRIT